MSPSRGGFASAFFFLLSAPAAIGGGLAIAPAAALAGLVGAPWLRLGERLRRHALMLALVSAFAVWASASTFWSPVGGTLQGARLLGGVATGFLLLAAATQAGPTRQLTRAAALAALILLAAFSAIEALADMPLNRILQPDAEHGALMRNPARGVSFLVLLFLAGMGGWLSGGIVPRIAAILCAPLVVWLSLQFEMDANALALAAGAAAFIITALLPSLGLIAVSGALAAWLLAAPWAIPALLNTVQSRFPALPDSWAIRTEVWRFVSERIAEKPILGRGMDAARAFTGQRAITNGIEHEIVPLHPHSASLHIWLETGAIGACLAAAALLIGGWLAARALRSERLVAGSAAAAIAALGVFWNVSYGMWQEWLIAAAFAAAALVITSRRRAA